MANEAGEVRQATSRRLHPPNILYCGGPTVSLTMARILITGGAGYVSSHCTKALAAVGHDSLLYSLMASSYAGDH